MTETDHCEDLKRVDRCPRRDKSQGTNEETVGLIGPGTIIIEQNITYFTA